MWPYRCQTDPEIKIRSASVHNCFLLFLSMANMEENPVFCILLKKFANITKSSFHKDTLPHSITHHIVTSGLPVHN